MGPGNGIDPVEFERATRTFPDRSVFHARFKSTPPPKSWTAAEGLSDRFHATHEPPEEHTQLWMVSEDM